MTYNQLIKHYGSALKVAAALNCTKQAVHRWKYIGIPIGIQIDIEVDSGGVLKADLPKEVREGTAA
jgi:hypothetical protein